VPLIATTCVPAFAPAHLLRHGCSHNVRIWRRPQWLAL
jgi:hypothetical protein